MTPDEQREREREREREKQRPPQPNPQPQPNPLPKKDQPVQPPVKKEARRREGREGEEEEPKSQEEELLEIGSPLRPDDKMNYFRAPNTKAIGTIFGYDIDQAGPIEAREAEPPDVYDETHPQAPGTGDGGWSVQQQPPETPIMRR